MSLFSKSRLHHDVPLVLALALCLAPRAFAQVPQTHSDELHDEPVANAPVQAPQEPSNPVKIDAVARVLPPAPTPAAPAKLVPISLGGFTGALHASYRVLGWTQPGIQLGRRDTGDPIDVLGKKTWLEHRLRVGAGLKRDALELRFEADVLNGLFAALPGGFVLAQAPLPPGGAPRPDLADPQRNQAWGVSASSFALRELALRWKTSAGLLTFGATTFHFGSGMLSNGAAGPLDAELADQRWGDRVVRLSFATRPLSMALGAGAPDLTVVLGLDLVLQDETAQLLRPLADWNDHGAIQDKAFGGILGLQHKTAAHSLGGFITRRSIRTPDSPELIADVTVPFQTDLQVWAFDLAGDLKHKLSEGPIEVFGAFEGALALGDANRVRNNSCPGRGDLDRCKILQGGLVARVGVRSAIVGFEVLSGYASGDADPFDDHINTFKLDRDFKAGLILFDEVLAWQSAASVRRALDPLLTNAGTPGLELLSTNGAVTNALFVQPTIKVQPFFGLQLVASVLWARAPQLVVDPYWTLKAGALTNAFGQAPGQSYGLELDAGVNWKRDFLPGLTVLAGLAGGLFLPGDAFAVDAAGSRMDSIMKVKARAAVQF